MESQPRLEPSNLEFPYAFPEVLEASFTRSLEVTSSPKVLRHGLGQNVAMI